MGQPLWKTAWQFLKKLDMNLLQNPAIALLGIYHREMQTYVHDLSNHSPIEGLLEGTKMS